MELPNLIPFLRPNLDILFVGLNPATKSSRNKHYFSVNQAFWNQLLEAGLIRKSVDKLAADDLIFGSNALNYNNWEYGITDLVTEYAESNSSSVEVSSLNCERLKDQIITYSPKTVVILHGTVLKSFLKQLSRPTPASNTGVLGKLISNCNSLFFNIAFPHGNSITSEEKINRYIELKRVLEARNT